MTTTKGPLFPLKGDIVCPMTVISTYEKGDSLKAVFFEERVVVPFVPLRSMSLDAVTNALHTFVTTTIAVESASSLFSPNLEHDSAAEAPNRSPPTPHYFTN